MTSSRSETNALSWSYPAAAGIQSECSKNLIAKVLAHETTFRKEVHVYRKEMVRNLSRIKRETDEMRCNVRSLWTRRKQVCREKRMRHLDHVTTSRAHLQRHQTETQINDAISALQAQEAVGALSSRRTSSRASLTYRRPSSIARLNGIKAVIAEEAEDGEATGGRQSVKSLDDVAIRKVSMINQQAMNMDDGSPPLVSGSSLPKQRRVGVVDQTVKPPSPDLADYDVNNRRGSFLTENQKLLPLPTHQTGVIGDTVDDNSTRMARKASVKNVTFAGDPVPERSRPVVPVLLPPKPPQAPPPAYKDLRKSRVKLIDDLPNSPMIDHDPDFLTSPALNVNKPKKAALAKPNEMSILHLVRLKESQNFSRRLSIVDRISSRIKARADETLANVQARGQAKNKVRIGEAAAVTLQLRGPYQAPMTPEKPRKAPDITIEGQPLLHEDSVAKTRRTSSILRRPSHINVGNGNASEAVMNSDATLTNQGVIDERRKSSIAEFLGMSENSAEATQLSNFVVDSVRRQSNSNTLEVDDDDTDGPSRRISLPSGVTAWRDEREQETVIVVTGPDLTRRRSSKWMPLNNHTLKVLRKDSFDAQKTVGDRVTNAMEKIRTCHYPAADEEKPYRPLDMEDKQF